MLLVRPLIRGAQLMKVSDLASRPPSQLVSLRAAHHPSPAPRSRRPRTAGHLSTNFTLLGGVAAPAAPAASLDASPAWPASERLDQLFQRSPALLLERSISERLGADADLWHTGCFQGEVYPDLPIASTWRDLVQRLFNLQGVSQRPQPPPPVLAQGSSDGSLGSGSSSSRQGSSIPVTEEQQQPGQQQQQQPWFVCTVAAQCRSRDQLRAFMLSAAGVDFRGEPKGGGRPADALLFVSGSHPARSLPAAGRWLQTSFDLLQLAATMREQGYLPPSLSLWGVENPMLAPVGRLQQKLDAGAEVILTQPPLAWGRAERWMQEADVRRLTDQARIVVGIPMVSSAGNLDFWLRLCGVRHLPECSDLLAGFPRQGDLGKEAFNAAVKQWNADLIQRVLDLPGVAGLHVMPLTKVARQMTAEFLKEGTLPSSACLATAKAGQNA